MCIRERVSMANSLSLAGVLPNTSLNSPASASKRNSFRNHECQQSSVRDVFGAESHYGRLLFFGVCWTRIPTAPESWIFAQQLQRPKKVRIGRGKRPQAMSPGFSTVHGRNRRKEDRIRRPAGLTVKKTDWRQWSHQCFDKFVPVSGV